jgi:hypothetical protein
MSKNGVITTLEGLEKWFRYNATSEWQLYSGHMDRLNPGKLIVKQENEDLPIDDSWELLRDHLEIQSSQGGQFTVFQPTSHNRGPKSKVTLNGHLMPGSGSFRGGSSLNGLPSLGYVTKEDMEERIRSEREKWELERRVDDLEEMQRSRASIGERIFETAVEQVDLNQVASGLMGFLGALTNKMGGNPSNIGSSQPQAVNQPAAASSDEGPVYDGDQVLEFLNTIRPHFENEEEFYSFLSRVRQFFEDKPGLCISFFFTT